MRCMRTTQDVSNSSGATGASRCSEYISTSIGQLPGRKLDRYAPDIDRIEVQEDLRAPCSAPLHRRA